MTRLPSVRVTLGAAAAAYGAGFAALSVLRQRAFATGRFDLGNMVQAVWWTAHGHPLRMTNLHGAQISRLAAHVDPLLAVFGPLWWIWPSPDLLLVVQALAIAAGAFPVYWLARKHLGSPRAALGFALVYLLYPATQWLTLNEFHPVALATPLLLYAFWFLDNDRLLPFALCAIAAAASKEEIGLVIAGLGLWYVLARHRTGAGLAIAALGLAWSAIAIGVVIPHFHTAGESDFYGRYSEVGGSAAGIVKTAFTHPGRIAHAAFSARDLHYVLTLVVPLAGLCLLAPLVIAAVLGAKRLSRWAIPVAMVAVVAAVAGNYWLGPAPIWRDVPGGSTFQATAARVTNHDRIAAHALKLIPKSAVVSATNTLGAHLSARRRVLSFPYVQDATWIAADETQPGYADRYAPVPTALALAALRRDPDWRLVFEQDGVLVFNRTPA